MKVVKKSHYYDNEIGETVIVVVFRADSGEENVEGAARPNADGSYLILINEQLSKERFDDAFAHERDHIIRGDFDFDKKGLSVEDIEAVAYGKKKDNLPGSEASERVLRYMRNYIRRLKRAEKKELERAEILSHFGLDRVLVVEEDEFGVPVSKWVYKKRRRY